MCHVHQGIDTRGQMGIQTRVAAALMLLAAACGSGGGGGSAGSNSGNGANTSFGVVRLLETTPADAAVQVPVDAELTLRFDAAMAVDSFGDVETWLRPLEGTEVVPMSFRAGANGSVICTPAAALAPETDYVFQLSPLTSDLNGRIVDVSPTFTFRTFDETPPTVVGLDVANGATGVSRTAALQLECSEPLAAASLTSNAIYLRDVFGGRFPIETTVQGDVVRIQPYADLPGNRQMTLVVTTLTTDRAGNQLTSLFQSSFTTQADTDRPSVLDVWPPLEASGVTPMVQPSFTFDESMDPDTVEAVSLLFQDEYGGIVPFAIEPSRDQRTLRVRPLVTLQQNRDYTLAFLLGAAAATDVSGNSLTTTQALNFTTGADAAPPELVESSPVAGESRAPGVLVARLVFDEPLDPDWVDTNTVQLLVAGRAWVSVVELVGGDTVRVTPVLTLPTDTECSLRLAGGQEGLRDLAGNVLAQDLTVGFTTSSDDDLPEAVILPPDGAAAVPTDSRIAILFDAPMDPATLTTETLAVTTDAGAPIAGTLVDSAEHRIVHFLPETPLSPNTYYRVRVRSGNQGARRLSGNWFDADRAVRFRTGTGIDTTPPTVTCSINAIAANRRDGMVLPPSGFEVEVDARDASGQWVDIGTLEVVLQGGTGPGADELLATARLGFDSAVVPIPASAPLSAGSWTLSARVRDLSGNVATSNTIAFQVDQASAAALPFERTQVVWVRTDMDRNGNGVVDFQDDMLRLGFATTGDPAGTNAYVEKLIRDGILAKANTIYRRGDRGEPIDGGSVPLRFTTRQPIALPHMQIALGGFDPEGSGTRRYGDSSTGVLGRAYYDYRNGNPTERNTSTSPGTGVFPAEMFLYQAEIHEQVYPSFQTVFASRFLPLCPSMGGTPCGSHSLDAIVLRADFDYANATTQQRARFNVVMEAADDWCSVIGVILAHEVGHSVGLVAPGPLPNGLYGDTSLHNNFASAAEVMAASVGYESMTTLDYQFRDLDLAYLRQRILLR